MENAQRADSELMAGITARDADAFDELRERHEATILHRISGIVRNPDASQDLLQETLLRVWTKSEQWDGKGSPAGWMLQIATNLALNHLRTLHRRRETELLDAGAASCGDALWGDEDSPDPESVLEEAERLRQMRALVDDLPEEKREIVRMVYDAEMSVRETAEALGVPEGTVKSRLHYSTKQLAREWRNLEDE